MHEIRANDPEERGLSDFDDRYFGTYFLSTDRSGQLSSIEVAVVDFCETYVKSRFPKMKYILGLSIDFILLAQSLRNHHAPLSNFDPRRSEETIFASYPLVLKRREKQANTLTLRYEGKEFGLRKFEELVLSYFNDQRKLGYPSAYVYNTGQWAKFKDLLVAIFQLSAFGRFMLLRSLLQFGNANIKVKKPRFIPKIASGIFERIINSYERSSQNENGGLAFQAIAYGLITVLYGHLNLSASGVRTGSARQQRFGDIDGYEGFSLVVSAEVKDIELSTQNYGKEVGRFVQEIGSSNVRGLVICRSFSVEMADLVKSSAPTISILSDAKLLDITSLWDDYLQRKACAGMLHFLANIEHNEFATERLSIFLNKN